MTAQPASLRRCVYTALTGRYETLNEQPVATGSAIPFICFTDNPDLVSETWQIRQLTPVFGADDARNQREYKLRPHRHLPQFNVSLYIDNSVLLRVPPEQIFDAVDLSSGLCLPAHSFRDTVLDEFIAVAQDNLDDPSRIFEQLNQYTIEAAEILAARPYWNAILLRDHHQPRVIAAMEIWLARLASGGSALAAGDLGNRSPQMAEKPARRRLAELETVAASHQEHPFAGVLLVEQTVGFLGLV